MELDAGFLVLQTGEMFKGWFSGGEDRAGEVVFNTSHSGYEEIATDPSYFQQIMVMTAPQQGNYGESDTFWESDKIHLQALVCVEAGSEWRGKLCSYGVPVLAGVDTRSVVLCLREKGTVMGAVVHQSDPKLARERALHLINSAKKLQTMDLPFMVTGKAKKEIKGKRGRGPRVGVLDFGCKHSIIKELAKRSRCVGVFPSRSSCEEILRWKPEGLLLSNGPGDPAQVQKAVQTVQKLLGRLFIFGICMGHQILALALGAKTYKLKFGHRGGNHPVKDLTTGKVYVTAQNHGYAVDQKSLPSHIGVNYINLNDQSVEGFFSQKDKCMGIQFHPESHPGPHEASVLFDRFIKHL